ncbi:MAG: N-6 DNA methylase [Methylococcaceae bacterium]
MKTIATETLRQGLKLVDIVESSNCLRFITEADDIKNIINNPSEWFALEQARKFKATAIYFKRFNDGRTSIPQIYIYDYTQTEYLETEFKAVQKNIWNAGIAPLIYVFTKTEIKIIDATKQPAIDNSELNYLENILLTATQVQQKLKLYSATLFDNGSFWDKAENKDKFEFKNFAYQNLKKSLVELKKSFVKKAVNLNLNEQIAQRLFLQSILIKYLEERKDEQGQSVFPSKYFEKYEGATNFCEVLKNGKALELFDELHQHQFNGEIFHWFDEKDRKLIRKANLSELAVFLYANEKNRQSQIWRLYSFEYIPIEFISSIYDEFIGDNKSGVVYTPLHLAKFLIDEAMPINNPKTDFKVIDPACGSGIFLVLAYKRLIEWWRIAHGKKPDVCTLKKILAENIAGIDISSEAIQLSIFSLSLALCDMLSPTEIWFELKFDNLAEKNIQCADFFACIDKLHAKFDLVIGNPPFKGNISVEINQTIKKKRKEDSNAHIPQGQLALLFATEAINILKFNGLLCMLMPAGSLLYNETSLAYKKYFSQYNVFQLLDFTPLQSILFDNKVKVAVAAIFLEKTSPDDKDILHLIVKRTKVAKEHIYFEIDEYDFHFVSKHLAINEPLIWKINLFGGGRLYYLIQKLKNLRTFGDFLKGKNKDGWYFCEGYKVGHSNDQSEEYLIEKKFKKADYITGYNHLPVDAFNENGIDKERIKKIDDIFYFERPRNKNKPIYEAPHILIKELIVNSIIPVVFVDYYLTFTDRIIGIHAPLEEKNELVKIKDIFLRKNKDYIFYLSCRGSVGINWSNSVISQIDIMNLPYPEDDSELELLVSEKIIRDDVLNYLIEFSSFGENAKVMQQTIIENLYQFSNIFCDVLNSVYAENDTIFQLTQIIKTNSFLCCKFVYQQADNLSIMVENSPELERQIRELIEHQTGDATIYNRIIRIYGNNTIYLIKPDILRYWLGSIALWDADKTLADLIDGGY